MDNAYFTQLLGMAEQNKKKQSCNSNFISLKVSAAKKQPKQTKLSSNIRNFLAKQDAEQRAKEKEDAEKTKALLTLRQGNKESSKAARRMLKMTKSANKSVVAETLNSKDTADTLAGRNQCDEDDYGYESNAARNLYEKLMTKYEANPEDPMAKFARNKSKKPKDIGSTVARVKESLASGDTDPMPSSSKSSSSKSSKSDRPPPPPLPTASTEKRPKKMAPSKPKTSFADLMKQAKQNHNKPVDFKEIKKKKQQVKECEFDRPMTEKEKAEYRREKSSQARKDSKTPAQLATNSKKSTISSGDKSFKKPGPLSSKKQDSKKPETTNHKPEVAKPKKEQPKKEQPKKEQPKKEQIKKQPSPPTPSQPAKNCDKQVLGKLSQAQIDKMRAHNRPGPSKRPEPQKPKRDISEVQSRAFPGERGYRPDKVAKKKPLARPQKSRSPSPVRKKFNPNNMALKRRRIESDDDEEDEDSDMDDFIDDSDAKIDISAEIRGIFGYDRRRFQNEGDLDDRSMENNSFASLMKEEAISAKIGMEEDLEDMRREEEEKKRKMKSKRRR